MTENSQELLFLLPKDLCLLEASWCAQSSPARGKNTPSLCFSSMGWSFYFFQVLFPWECHMSSQNGPLPPREWCAKYWTKALFRFCHWRAETKGQIPFAFLLVASLFTLAQNFGEYSLYSSPQPALWHKYLQLCSKTSIPLPLHGGASCWVI